MNKWKTAIYQQLEGDSPWSDRNDLHRYEGLERQLQDSPADQREEWVQACAELLITAEWPIRSGIVAVLLEIAEDLGAEWLTEQWLAHPELFLDIPPVEPCPFKTLDKGLFRAIAHALQPEDSQAIALLRQVAVDPEWGSWVVPALAKHDADWLIHHAREVVPHRMVSVLIPLSSEQRRQLIQKLAPWPREVLDNISPGYWRQFSPQEAQELQQMMLG